VVPPAEGEDPADVQALASARERVLARIAAACDRAGRDPDSVALIAVSKTVPAERLRAAVTAGLTSLGENRVQEGVAKAAEVRGATWDLVGPLQSNKVRRALEVFDRIQTVDSVGLAARVDRIAAEVRPGARYPVLLQVNVDVDPAKAGFEPGDVAGALPEVLGLANLAVGGLMTVGRLTTDPAATRATFRGLRELSDDLRGRWPGLGPELSMGMTDDFEVAIEEGATIVRVGRALFGERPHDHGGEGEHTH
jgi:pyridoxal phosphate enzyme (YggS family)